VRKAGTRSCGLTRVVDGGCRPDELKEKPVMKDKKYPRNNPCPCGSGAKYKHCCIYKKFKYVIRANGEVGRRVPLPKEASSALKQLRQAFIDKHGREPNPEDSIFDPEDVARAHGDLVDAMRKIGIDEAIIYAYDKTGILLTEQNMSVTPTSHIQEFEAAVEEYRASRAGES
jgi:hypothetical protein